MSDLIARFDPSAKASGSFVVTSLSNGIGKLILWNESNWTLDLTFSDGTTDIASAWLASIYDLTGPVGSISWTQDKQVSSNAPPISQVWVVAYRNNETIPGVFPVALNRQSVVSGGVGNPAFSATVGFGSTTGARQKLNVFNPPNSGVSMTFHSARVYDDNTGSPTANLAIVNGADLNLATPVTITSHTGSANPPVSVGHASSEDVAIQAIPGTTIEVMDMQSMVTMDFLDYPDTVTLAPGNNLLIDLAQSGTGHIVRHTLKWSESPLSIPTQVINMTTQTASNIINDGNAAGTGLIRSIVLGDTGSAVSLTNDAQMTLGDAAYPGKLTIDEIDGTPILQLYGMDNGDANLSAKNGDVNLQCLQDTGNATLASRIFQRINHFWNGTNDIYVSNNPAYQFAFNLVTGGITLRKNSNVPSIGGTVLWQTVWTVDSFGTQTLTGTLQFPIGSLTKINIFSGTGSSAGVLNAHGLGVKPDFCVFQETGTAGDTNTFSWDVAASDTTNVMVWSANATARPFIALAIKL